MRVEYRDWLASEGSRRRRIPDLRRRLHGVVLRFDRSRSESDRLVLRRARWRARRSVSLLDGDPSRDRLRDHLAERSRRDGRATRANAARPGFPFFYDPVAAGREALRRGPPRGMEGAAVLICNDYEWGMILQKTGMAESEILSRVATLIVTHGAEGSRFRSGPASFGFRRPALRGAGASTRRGSATPSAAAFSRECCAGDRWEFCGPGRERRGAFCLESVGPQPPRMRPEAFVDRFRESYGDAPRTFRSLRAGSGIK